MSKAVTALMLAGLVLLPLYSYLSGNIFILTLFTRIVILALAAASLNLIMNSIERATFARAVPLDDLSLRPKPPRPPTSPNTVLAIVCVGICLANLDLFIVNVALPSIGQDFKGASLDDMFNPLMFAAATWLAPRLDPRRDTPQAAAAVPEPIRTTDLTDHTIVIGYGRVGALVGDALKQRRLPFLVAEVGESALEKLKQGGIETVTGNAAQPEILDATNPSRARHLVIAIPEAFEAGQIVQQARAANPDIRIIARAHVLANDAFLEANKAHWLVNEIRHYWKRVLKRIDVTSRTLVTLIEPGSCFAGTLAELVFAADRSYMLIGTRQGDNRPPPSIELSAMNFGPYPMSHAQARQTSSIKFCPTARSPSAAVRPASDGRLPAADIG